MNQIIPVPVLDERSLLELRVQALERLVLEMTKHVSAEFRPSYEMVAHIAELKARHPDV